MEWKKKHKARSLLTVICLLAIKVQVQRITTLSIPVHRCSLYPKGQEWAKIEKKTYLYGQ